MEKEPSYYEVALTNRQVVVGFTILLACLFVAFLSGVWIGRDAATPVPTRIAEAPRAAGDAQLEKLTFFGERSSDANAAGAAPKTTKSAPPREEPPRPTAAEIESERLRQTLEAEMSAHREAEPAAEPAVAPPARAESPTPGARVRRAPSPAPAAVPATETTAVEKTAPPPPAGGEPFWIQVYSSTNGARAREIAANLKRNRFGVRVLETAVASGTTFRVRVGPYAAKAEADLAAQRLRREFKLDTWVTDQP